MKRKLLFYDIDGTLAAGGSGRVSETVKEAIRQARRNGHLAFISTGRSEPMVNASIKEIGFDGGIYSAGGKVTCQGITISSNTLAPETVKLIIDMLKKEPDVFYLLECDSLNFFGNGNSPIFGGENEEGAGVQGETDGGSKKLDLQKAEGLSSEMMRIRRILLKSGQKSVEEYDGTPVFKVSFFSGNLEALDRTVANLEPYGKVVTFESIAPETGICSGEISDWKINKGTALRDVCVYLGAEVADTLAWGDSMNDIEIIEAAGIGVAMGNAEKRVKEIADVICESVEEDGVAKEMKRQGLI